LTVLAALICIACAALIGFLAVATINDPYTRAGDFTHWWCLVGIVVCIPPILASLGVLLFSVTLSSGVFRATRVLLFIAMAGMTVLTVVGFLLLQETERKGGDWAALGIFAVYAFGIAPPIVVGGLCAFLLVPLSVLKRKLIS
jgi:hypothetical protein